MTAARWGEVVVLGTPGAPAREAVASSPSLAPVVVDDRLADDPEALEALLAARPDVRVVHLTRHPLATVGAAALDQAAAEDAWVTANGNLVDLADRLGPERCLVVRWEDLQRGDTDALRRFVDGAEAVPPTPPTSAEVAVGPPAGAPSVRAGRALRRLATELGYALEDRPVAATPTGPVPGAGDGPVPVARPGRVPVSAAQARFLFVESLEPGVAVFLLPSLQRITGPLDHRALEAAVTLVVARHEALRTDFEVVDGAWYQAVAAPAPVTIPVDDVRGWEPVDVDAAVADELQRPFDLGSGPKARAHLFRTGDDEHLLAVTVHHLVADGTSIVRLSEEFGAAYQAILADTDPDLPDLAVQYADVSTWEWERLAAGALDDQLEHWRRRLAGALPVLELPTDRPRPPIVSYRAGSIAVGFDADLAAAVRSVARREGVTPYMFLLSSYAATLARWSGAEELVVGTAAANRRAETAHLVGLFVSTLPLRLAVDRAAPFADLLQVVKREALDALANQEVPFDQIVRAVNPPRDQSRSPLFQTMFVLNNMRPAASGPIGGITVEEVPVAAAGTDVDLSVTLTDGPSGITGRLVFAAALFDPGTLERFVRSWEQLLRAAVADPGLAVADLAIVDDADRDALLALGQGPTTALPPWSRVEGWVAAQAEATPSAPAVRDASTSSTYGEVDDAANRFAHHLVEAGVRPGDRVGVAIDRSARLVPVLLGIWKAGAAYVPLDPRFPSARLRFMVDDAALTHVVVDRDRPGLTEEPAPGVAAPVVIDLRLEQAVIDTRPTSRPAVPAGDGDAAAYVIYTSGSTGVPKGVAVRHRAVVNLLEAMRHEPGLGAEDVVLALTTIAFDISVLELFLPLVTGASVVVATADDALDANLLAAVIDGSGATVVQATPTTYSMLFEVGWRAHPGLTLLSGGEALSPALATRLVDGGATVWNVFGPTETTVWSTAFRVTSAAIAATEGAALSIGRPIANTVCRVLDEGLGLVPVGMPGELHIGGAGVAIGYLHRPELTAERFGDDPFEPGERLYRTGDRARWRPDGTLEFLGRLDQQVKVRGHRIELGEIESALRTHPAVVDAVAVVDGDGASARVAAYVTVVDEPDDDLRAWARTGLPAYMVPAVVVVLDALPLTPNRKVDRRALPPLGDAVADRERSAPAEGDVEQVLAALMAGVLDLAQVGRSDDFFELGGHSLLATRLLARVTAAFGSAVALRPFFGDPTVEGLAGQLLEDAADRRRLDDVARLLVGRDLALVATEDLRAAVVEAGLGAGEAVGPRPAVRPDPLPASAAQQRMLFLESFESDLAVFNLPSVTRLVGALDPLALEAALTAVVARHEALRTGFALVEGTWTQVVAPPEPVALARQDGRGLDEAEVAAIVTAEVHRPFDVGTAPKLRARLLRIDESEHLLVVTVHHLAADGTSIVQLVEETAAVYDAVVAGTPADLPTVDLQYADAVLWEQAVAGGARDARLERWRARLAGGLPVLDVPTDRPRPATFDYTASSVEVELPPELSTRVREAARRAGTTPFVVLLASWSACLARWSGADEVMVGTATANRRPETERVVGPFASTVPLRIAVDPSASFAGLLGTVKEEAVAVLDDGSVTLDEIVRAVNPLRDPSRSPLFQTLFVLNNMGGPRTSALRGLTAVPVPVAPPAVDVDLYLSLVEGPDGFVGRLDVAAALFDDATAERLVRSWRRLLEAAVDDPAARLAELPLVGAADERQQRLVERGPSRPLPTHSRIEEWVAARAAETPDAPAVGDATTAFTYRELVEAANRTARHLAARGVRPGDRIGLAVTRSAATYPLVLGALAAGATYLPLDLSFPVERLRAMVEDAGLTHVVVDRQALEAAGGAVVAADEPGAPVVIDLAVEGPVLDARSCEAIAVDGLDGDQAAYVIYTSGSTGVPKGVAVPHRAVLNLLASMQREPGLEPGDVMVGLTTLSFDMSVPELFWPLVTGASLVVATPDEALDANLLAALIEQSGATVLQATPTSLSMLYEVGWSGGRDLKVLCGGEAMPPALGERLVASCGSVWNMFGPTETTVWSTTTPVTAELLASTAGPAVPIGRPMDNTVCRVLDGRGRSLPVGVPGELHIGGAGVAIGYLHRPELTAERFVDDPLELGARLYRTGDLARWRVDGTLEFLGRLDHQVKVRGHRIELGELESTLRSHPEVVDAVAVLDGVGPSARLVAYVTLERSTAAPPSPTGLRGWLRERLPAYMVPAGVSVLERFPLTPSRKVDRRALPALDAQVEEPSAPPATDVERVVARAMAAVLDRGSVGRTDDFFDLGGHSLLATSLLARLSATFGCAIALRPFFAEPTVAGLAAHLLEDPSDRDRIEGVARVEERVASMSPEEIRAALAARRPAGERA